MFNVTGLSKVLKKMKSFSILNNYIRGYGITCIILDLNMFDFSNK